MKRVALPLILSTLAGASPAAAQGREWGRKDNMVITRDATGCTVTGVTKEGVAVEIREEADGRLSFRAAHAKWRFAARRSYPIRLIAKTPTMAIGMSTSTPVAAGAARGFRDARGWRGFELPVELPQMAQAHNVTDIEIFDGDRPTPIASVPNFSFTDALRRSCVAGIARTAPSPGKPAVTFAKPRGGMASFVTRDDYPAAALRAEEQGVSMLRITVSPAGRVDSCSIHASSGSVALDATACSLMKRRARFTAALDAEGQPTSDEFIMPFEWKLPAQ